MRLPLVILALALGCPQQVALARNAPLPQATADSLESLAAVEPLRGPRAPLTIPIPPGVEKRVLLPDAAREEISRADLAATLERVLVKPDPPVAIEVDEADRREGLRRYIKGREAFLEGTNLIAITELESAMKADPSSSEILRLLARAYLTRGLTPRGTERYAQLLALDPEDGEALLVLGLDAASRGEFDDAIQFFGRLLQSGPEGASDPGGPMLTRYWLWHSMAQRGFDAASTELAETLLSGSMLVPSSRYAAQLAAIERQRGAVHRVVGDAWCRLGDHDRALASYTAAGQLPTGDPELLFVRLAYVNLILDRPFNAQLNALDAARRTDTAISERTIGLVGYVAEHVADSSPLRQRMEKLAAQFPASDGLARAAAATLPAEEAIARAASTHRRATG